METKRSRRKFLIIYLFYLIPETQEAAAEDAAAEDAANAGAEATAE